MKFHPLYFGSALVALAVLAGASSAEDRTGEQIYKQMCARCHGAKGEGAKNYPLPLTGDKSLPQLTGVIARTMPEGEPEALDAEGGKRVSAFIYDSFYSPDAQARRNPPRVELSRLTVKQYRNSVADVLGGFRGAPKIEEKPGLRGEYFNARGFQGNKRVIDRTDAEVKFDFGKSGPNPDQPESFDPNTFCIRWEGSVWAPDTGVYEFVVRTDHALRLWVNDNRKPVIDAWVKSGDATEFKASLFLLAGRAYPIRLEFSKAKQGVDDSNKSPKPPVKPAFVSLNWKRPNRAIEVIPARNLTPQKFPEVFVVEAPFPPDDRSLGWERGTTVSKEWDAATTQGALETAAYVVARLPELSGTAANAAAADRLAKVKAFCRTFAERAFRRPLTAAEAAQFVDRPLDGAPDLDLAVKRVVLLVLKSPRFLYPDAGTAPEPYALATRLSYAIWDAPPDKELLAAASGGKLATRDEVARQAERMLSDPRARAKLREFLIVWLKLDQARELSKDAKRFPGFDAELANDLRTSLELFLDEVVWSAPSDFRQLLLADEVYLNGRLAKFYGADLAADAPFQKVKFEAARRSGVLTHPYTLSTLAYSAESSPIHRGVFVGRGLLGVAIKPPMEAFTPLAAEQHPNLTTRERVTLQTKPMACSGCHSIMNPLGFALENFDAVGRYREKEDAKAIDVSGSYEQRSGAVARFTGAKELAKFLANSDEVHAAFAQQAFHHYVKQPVRAYGLRTGDELRKTFAESGYNVRKLIVEIAVTGAMARTDPTPPNK